MGGLENSKVYPSGRVFSISRVLCRRIVAGLAGRSVAGRMGDARGSVTHTTKHINISGAQAPASRAAAFAVNLEKLREKAVMGGGQKRIEVQHSKGKLTARERLEVCLLLPPLFPRGDDNRRGLQRLWEMSPPRCAQGAPTSMPCDHGLGVTGPS